MCLQRKRFCVQTSIIFNCMFVLIWYKTTSNEIRTFSFYKMHCINMCLSIQCQSHPKRQHISHNTSTRSKKKWKKRNNDNVKRALTFILARLSTKCSWWVIVTGLCPSSSVVRRSSTLLLKHLLLWNFDQTSQEWPLGVTIPKLINPFQLIA